MVYDPLKWLIHTAAEEALYAYRKGMTREQARHFGRGWLMAETLWNHGECQIMREAVHRAKLSQEAEKRLNKARSKRKV